MNRLSCFNGLLVIVTLIMAQAASSVRAHPLQPPDLASPSSTDARDHPNVRTRRSTRDINDNLVRKQSGNNFTHFTLPYLVFA